MKEGINRKGSGRSFYLSDQWDFSPYPPEGETNFAVLFATHFRNDPAWAGQASIIKNTMAGKLVCRWYCTPMRVLVFLWSGIPVWR
jgi:hypothetical protein